MCSVAETENESSLASTEIVDLLEFVTLILYLDARLRALSVLRKTLVSVLKGASK